MDSDATISWSPGPDDLRLEPNEVHLWCAHLLQPVHVFNELYETLSPAEKERAAAFIFEKDQKASAVARGILRALLARYLRTPPGNVRFASMGNDKPILAPDSSESETLHFNTSHSGEMVLYGFTRIRDIGVDIEKQRPLNDAIQIAENYFSSREKISLRAVPPEHKTQAFFDCWSRKEAFIKTYGEGLSRDLASFDVALTPGEPARLLAIEGQEAAAANWTLQNLNPTLGYSAAFCLEGKPTGVRTYSWP